MQLPTPSPFFQPEQNMQPPPMTSVLPSRRGRRGKTICTPQIQSNSNRSSNSSRDSRVDVGPSLMDLVFNLLGLLRHRFVGSLPVEMLRLDATVDLVQGDSD